MTSDGDVSIRFEPTSTQLADCFTKPNDELTFLKFRERLVTDVSPLL